LTEVVEQQRGQDEAEPGDPDRQSPEMAHVRVERLGAGDRKKNGAEREERRPLVRCKQRQGIVWVQRKEYLRRLNDLHEAQGAENEKPQTHDRPEEQPDLACAAALDDEQRDQDAERERHHVRLEQRRRDLQTLNCAQHRDRRRDQPVAVE
jgi:hypothetical protein